jgi:hypothetical protein
MLFGRCGEQRLVSLCAKAKIVMKLIAACGDLNGAVFIAEACTARAVHIKQARTSGPTSDELGMKKTRAREAA